MFNTWLVYVPALMPNVEDGLFSRFSFVLIEKVPSWRSPFLAKVDKSSVIAPLSMKVLNMYKVALKNDFNFVLSEQQQDTLDTKGREWLSKAQNYGSNGESIAFRSGIILFRTAMVLASIKHFEDDKKGLVIECTDEQFEFACSYCEANFHDSLQTYTICGKTTSATKLSPKEAQLYQILPDEYEMPKDVNHKAAEIGIGERTALKYQKKFICLNLVKVMQGKKWSKVA